MLHGGGCCLLNLPPTVLEVVKMNPSGLLRKPGQPKGEVARLEYGEGIRMGVLYDLGWETASKPFAKFACLWNGVSFDKGSLRLQSEVVGDEVCFSFPFLSFI
jgi:hypothetical protein